jgi:hypothetical protein
LGSFSLHKALVVTSVLLAIEKAFYLLNQLVSGRLSHYSGPKVPKTPIDVSLELVMVVDELLADGWGIWLTSPGFPESALHFCQRFLSARARKLCNR